MRPVRSRDERSDAVTPHEKPRRPIDAAPVAQEHLGRGPPLAGAKTMHAAALPSLQLILINIGFALLMVSAGFFAGWWVFSGTSGDHDAPDESEADRDRERARAALARIRELANSVAHDVGAHNTRVQEITTDLHEYRIEGNEDIDGVVLATVAEMMKANEQLQSQLASAEQKLQQQAEEIEHHAATARTDPLTQVNNRRAFDLELERRFVEWKRLQSPYSVVLIDVDFFKKFNDVHGHQAGDEVLRGVARVLNEAMREMDVVCRYGGEEFAIIMPATEGEQARQGAERARTAIEAAKFQFEGTTLQVTASVGVAEIQLGEDNETLIRRADEALYASKKQGRNTTHFHTGTCSIPISPKSPRRAVANESPAEKTSPGVETSTADEESTNVNSNTLAKLPQADTFLAELGRRIAEAQRLKTPLSVMLIHIDDFAHFTEQFGAQVGTCLLDTVAQYLDILLRDMDLLAHYKDDRFVVMLPGSELEDTTEIGRRLRRAIADFAIPTKNTKLRLSVSLGLTSLATNDDNEIMLQRAERALAAAIANGPDAAYLHDGKRCQAIHYEEPAHSSPSP